MTRNVKITVDGKQMEAPEESPLLGVLLEAGFDIPTLCWHDSVAPYGACRLCLVEVNQKGWKPDWRKLTTSCNFPVLDGLTVTTQSEKIAADRRLMMELILARAPEAPKVRAMAEKLGVKDIRARKQEGQDCILCGLCARVCSEVIGANAITFVGRGGDKDMTTAFDESAGTCIGDGACDAVCPTGAVGMQDVGLRRIFKRWKTEHELVPCRICGKPVGTLRQIEDLRKKMFLEEDIFVTCTDCKRDRYARTVIAEGHL